MSPLSTMSRDITLVDLRGLEPLTSSMPWRRSTGLSYRPRVTWGCLVSGAGLVGRNGISGPLTSPCVLERSFDLPAANRAGGPVEGVATLADAMNDDANAAASTTPRYRYDARRANELESRW